MKRVAAMLGAMLVGAGALWLLVEDDDAPPPPPPAVSLAPAELAPEPAPEPSAVPEPEPAPPVEPTPAPAAGDEGAAGEEEAGIRDLLSRLRRRGPRWTRSFGSNPVRDEGAPGAPTDWVPGPDGVLVPVYTADEVATLEDSAADVLEKRGSVVGALEHAAADAITGFAYDWTRLEVVPTVELFVDGFKVATQKANATRPGVAGDDPSRGRGFSFPAPASLADGNVHSVQVVARTGHDDAAVELAGSPRDVGGNQTPRGALAPVQDGVLTGWALDPDHPGEAIEVEVLWDGRSLGRFPANGDVGAPPAGHWFSVQLPADAPDEPHVAQVLIPDPDVPGLKTEAHGSPWSAEKQGELPYGALFQVTSEVITGWAIDKDVGEEPIEVEVYFDGVLYERQRADKEFAALVHREDISSPYHLFQVDIPAALKDGKTHTVSVFAVNTPEGANPELGGSPATFVSSANARPSGFLDVANAQVIAGWAYDADAGAAPVEVEIWIDDELWQVVPAAHRRPDLVPVVSPEPEHGFHVPAPEVLGDGEFHTVRVLARNTPEGAPYELSGSPRELAPLRPYLGVTLTEPATGPGLRVASVVAESPAQLAGLEVEERIVAHNGQPTLGDVAAFVQWTRSRAVGEAVRLTIARREPAAPPAPEELDAITLATLQRLVESPTAPPEEVALPDGRIGVLTPSPSGLGQAWFSETRRDVYPVLAELAG